MITFFCCSRLIFLWTKQPKMTLSRNSSYSGRFNNLQRFLTSFLREKVSLFTVNMFYLICSIVYLILAVFGLMSFPFTIYFSDLKKSSNEGTENGSITPLVPTIYFVPSAFHSNSGYFSGSWINLYYKLFMFTP